MVTWNTGRRGDQQQAIPFVALQTYLESQTLMNLPDDFQFSQSSLQDFADCPRRFYLKYIQQLHYPAAESAPLRDFEESMERGTAVPPPHSSAPDRHSSGGACRNAIPDETIETWWENYLRYALNDLPARRFPEITLSAPLAGRRLVAKYDLLAIGAERAVIVDWKTAHNRPKRERLDAAYKRLSIRMCWRKRGRI